MSHKNDLSRRDLLKIAAATSGVASLGGLVTVPGIFNPQAFAQAGAGEKSAVLIVYLQGGYNALFGSADSFSGAGSFGVTAANQLNLGNGLIVDSSFSTLSAFAKTHMASVGIRHGIAAHGAAKTAQFTSGNQNPAIALAAGLGGDGSIKAANIGSELVPGPKTAVGGVSLQPIADMQSTIDALGGGTPSATMPKRDLAAKGIAASNQMSLTALSGNPDSLVTVKDGYKSAIETLTKPAEVFSAQELMTGYKLTSTAIADFNSKMAGAELMIRAGANVVTVSDGGALGWDTHGDTTGARARQKFLTTIVPGLKTFTDRMLEKTGFNVTVVIFGDFARSLPGSDHASVSVATVIGKSVKLGTTGKVDTAVGLPAGAPPSDGLWGYLAALSKASPATVQAFGGNPHTIITA